MEFYKDSGERKLRLLSNDCVMMASAVSIQYTSVTEWMNIGHNIYMHYICVPKPSVTHYHYSFKMPSTTSAQQ